MWFLVTCDLQPCPESSLPSWILSLDKKVYDGQTVFPENDEEQEVLPSLDKPGWYSQGNAVQLYELLKKMTGKPEPKVFSDSEFLMSTCRYKEL